MKASNRKKKSPRGFLRRSASSDVKVSCFKKDTVDAGPNLTTLALDLSQAGARLLVTVPLQVGEEVVLGLEGPSCPNLLLRQGKVVWSIQVTECRYAVGVRLDEQLDGDRLKQVTIPPRRLDY